MRGISSASFVDCTTSWYDKIRRAESTAQVFKEQLYTFSSNNLLNNDFLREARILFVLYIIIYFKRIAMHRTTVRESDSNPFSGRPEFPLQPMTRKQMVLLLVRVSFLLDERRTFLIIPDTFISNASSQEKKIRLNIDTAVGFRP